MPVAKTIEKEKAIALRKKGKSITEISNLLKVSKSSVSYWCRDVVLSQKQIEVLINRQQKGAIKGGEKKRLKRLERVKSMKNKGIEDVGAISKRDLFVVGLALYWGEGYKKGSQETALTNSDPAIIKTFVKWLREAYGIQRKDLILRVSINQLHRSREKEVKRFWSKTIGIPESQFTKTSFIKTASKKIYTNTRNHFGTLRVKVRRGTDLRRRILGSIEALKLYSTNL